MTSQEDNGNMDNIPLSSDSDAGKQSSVEQENIKNMTYSTGTLSLDGDNNLEDDEEKQRLISQVLELQNTLDDLSSRVDTVKVENLKLKSENQVLGQYIENLMAASSVFQSATPKAKKK
ncbi:short coiled-coil protein B-like [Babylonia areolata]|uniref:short coiled-coil protein B-like n=1 Tax=Babylonia areolata TaxID=304850 RepID=UPI003FD56FC2